MPRGSAVLLGHEGPEKEPGALSSLTPAVQSLSMAQGFHPKVTSAGRYRLEWDCDPIATWDYVIDSQ